MHPNSMIKRMITPILVPVLVGVLLTGCANQQKKTQIKTPNHPVNSELKKALEQNKQRMLNIVPIKRFDVVAHNSDTKVFLQRLAEQGGENVIIDPAISGKISINLKSVTFKQALEAIRDLYGIHFEKTTYGYQFFAKGEQTRLFQVDYPSLSRKGDSGIQVKGHSLVGSVGAASSIVTSYESDFWLELTKALNELVSESENNKVIVNKQSGLVVVTASGRTMAKVQRYLTASQSHMIRQVVIEAKILEVRLSDRFSSGVKWSELTKQVGDVTLGSTLESSPVQPASGLNGVFGLSLALDNMSAAVELLGSQGDVQVLSSPRISTINNQKAVIKVGSDDYYVKQVTPEKNEQGEVQDISIEFESIFSGIALDVTPKITDNNEIILHVRPTITEVSEVEKVITYGQLVHKLPMASSKVRETDSMIRANNNQIIIIGGLLQSLESEQDAGVPLISRIPGLGSLFNQKELEANKSELVILLKPSIITDDVWNGQIEASYQRVQPAE